MKAYKGGKSSNHGKDTDPNLLRVIREPEKRGNKVKMNESENKFSAMLLDLVSPFHQPFPHLEELKHLMDLAAFAWNTANMKRLLPEAGKIMMTEVKENFKDDQESIDIIEKLVKAKEKKYPKEELFIRHFTVEEGKEGGLVTVTACSMEDFMLDVAGGEQDEDDMDTDNFAPGFVDRNGFSLVHKQPFIDWVKKFGDEAPYPIEADDSTVYLLHEKAGKDELLNWLKKNFDKVFQKELELYIDQKSWPTNRNYKMFTEWFDIKFHFELFDFEAFPIDKKE
jgi:hypothetical protein